MHAAVRHGTPSFTSLPKHGEVGCEVSPPRSPIRSLTSLDHPESCLTRISRSATHQVLMVVSLRDYLDLLPVESWMVVVDLV